MHKAVNRSSVVACFVFGVWRFQNDMWTLVRWRPSSHNKHWPFHTLPWNQLKVSPTNNKTVVSNLHMCRRKLFVSGGWPRFLDSSVKSDPICQFSLKVRVTVQIHNVPTQMLESQHWVVREGLQPGFESFSLHWAWRNVEWSRNLAVWWKRSIANRTMRFTVFKHTHQKELFTDVCGWAGPWAVLDSIKHNHRGKRKFHLLWNHWIFQENMFSVLATKNMFQTVDAVVNISWTMRPSIWDLWTHFFTAVVAEELGKNQYSVQNISKIKSIVQCPVFFSCWQWPYIIKGKILCFGVWIISIWINIPQEMFLESVDFIFISNNEVVVHQYSSVVRVVSSKHPVTHVEVFLSSRKEGVIQHFDFDAASWCWLWISHCVQTNLINAMKKKCFWKTGL